jgi:hypothetical protein
METAIAASIICWTTSQNLPQNRIGAQIDAHHAEFSTDNTSVHQKTTILTSLTLSRSGLASGSQMLYLEVS